MNEIQLFYLTIMIALLIIYLSISKICEAMQEISKYKALILKQGAIIDCRNAEDVRRVINEINTAINNEEENKNGM